ncbi:hypothetical protein M948_03570 [Virgibacillus sp. CM-4]|nr:hypothetical protein M948_03570 [Virgibacillus sp. CM-4]
MWLSHTATSTKTTSANSGMQQAIPPIGTARPVPFLQISQHAQLFHFPVYKIL